MKITLSFTIKVFIAVILALLPYIAVIEKHINASGGHIAPYIYYFISVNIVVYILAVIGLEVAEKQAEEKGLNANLSIYLFILLLMPFVLKYLKNMAVSLIPQLMMIHVVVIDDVILISYTLVMFLLFYKYSNHSVYYLVPLFMYNAYSALVYVR